MKNVSTQWTHSKYLNVIGKHQLTALQKITQPRHSLYRPQLASEACKPKSRTKSKEKCRKPHWAKNILVEVVQQILYLDICVRKGLPNISSKRARLEYTGVNSRRRIRHWRGSWSRWRCWDPWYGFFYPRGADIRKNSLFSQDMMLGCICFPGSTTTVFRVSITIYVLIAS